MQLLIRRQEAGRKGDGKHGAEHCADKHAGHHGNENAVEVIALVLQPLFAAEEGIEQEKEDDGADGKADLIQQEEVGGGQHQGAPEFYLVVILFKESAELGQDAFPGLDALPGLQNQNQQTQRRNNDHQDPGNDPVLRREYNVYHYKYSPFLKYPRQTAAGWFDGGRFRYGRISAQVRSSREGHCSTIFSAASRLAVM